MRCDAKRGHVADAGVRPSLSSNMAIFLLRKRPIMGMSSIGLSILTPGGRSKPWLVLGGWELMSKVDVFTCT